MILTHSLNDHIATQVKSFLELGPPEELTLTLDGFGVNSALHYSILSLIGIDRLKRFGEINIISGSTYAWFCFWAFHHGKLRPSQAELRTWDQTHLKLSGIRPFVTATGILAGRVMREKKWLIPTQRLLNGLEYLVDSSIVSARVCELPKNLRFWLYDRSSRDLVVVSANSEFSQMQVKDLIQAAPNVPGVFQEFLYNGRSLVDPVYSPKRSEMYRTVRSSPSYQLISSPTFDKREGSILYVKPHPFPDGKKMIRRDLLRYILGRRNPAINDAIQNGLFNPDLKEIKC